MDFIRLLKETIAEWVRDTAAKLTEGIIAKLGKRGKRPRKAKRRRSRKNTS